MQRNLTRGSPDMHPTALEAAVAKRKAARSKASAELTARAAGGKRTAHIGF